LALSSTNVDKELEVYCGGAENLICSTFNYLPVTHKISTDYVVDFDGILRAISATAHSSPRQFALLPPLKGFFLKGMLSRN
jgi:hypothetical protein